MQVSTSHPEANRRSAGRPRRVPAAAKPADGPEHSVAARLLTLVERLERIELLQQQLARESDLVFDQVQHAGFDPSAVRRLLHRRAHRTAPQTLDQLIAAYRRALGPVGR